MSNLVLDVRNFDVREYKDSILEDVYGRKLVYSSYDGIYCNFYNKSEKVIKEVEFYCCGRDRVGDIVPTVTNSLRGVQSLEVKGPFQPGEYTAFTSKAIWKHNSVQEANLIMVCVTFMDGTEWNWKASDGDDKISSAGYTSSEKLSAGILIAIIVIFFFIFMMM